MTTSYPPDPTHSSMPDSSPIADKDMGAPDLDHDVDTRLEGETGRVDVVIEEEYFEEELDYEDNVPTEEHLLTSTSIKQNVLACGSDWVTQLMTL